MRKEECCGEHLSEDVDSTVNFLLRFASFSLSIA